MEREWPQVYSLDVVKFYPHSLFIPIAPHYFTSFSMKFIAIQILAASLANATFSYGKAVMDMDIPDGVSLMTYGLNHQLYTSRLEKVSLHAEIQTTCLLFINPTLSQLCHCHISPPLLFL